MQDARASRPKLLALQALRAFAACSVAFFHAADMAQRYSTQELPFMRAIGIMGSAGVDLFFVISGFVMFYTTQHLPPGPKSARWFFLRRIVRIVPLYWLLTSLMIVLLIVVPSVFNRLAFEPWHALASYFFIPWPNNRGEPFPVLGLGWSLNYEMYFYLVMAIMLFTSRRFLFIALLFAATMLYGLLFKPEGLLPQMLTSLLMLEFLLGGAVAELLRIRQYRLPCPALLFAAGTAWFIIALAITDPGGPWRAVNYGSGAALLVAGLVAWETKGTLRIPAMPVALGDSSYAIYLFHPLAMAGFGKLWVLIFGAGSAAGLLLIFFSLAVASGHILYLWVEKPMTSRLNRKLKSAIEPPPSF